MDLALKYRAYIFSTNNKCSLENFVTYLCLFSLAEMYFDRGNFYDFTSLGECLFCVDIAYDILQEIYSTSLCLFT